MEELTADEARRLSLRAQGMIGAPDRRGGVPALLQRLAAVQLDTISVLARSHELVAYARLGAVGRAAVDAAYWSGDAFEYWAHAACVLPAEQWPLFAFRRRHYGERGWRWHAVEPSVCDTVLARLRDEGPMTSTDLGGAKRGGVWWDWSDVKIAVEYLLDTGAVVCSERRAWKRVYDLPERVLPAEALAVGDTLDDAECRRRLVAIAGRALGVATLADLTDFHRLRQADVAAVVGGSGLVPVTVRGWGKAAWADPDLLAAGLPKGRHRTTLLSPFDTLAWDRARTERIFGFVHRLEAYTPAPKRVHGYFAMPLLAGGRLVGRVDPGRDGRTLVAKTLTVEPRAIDAMATALREAATWVGCDAVALGEVRPASAAPALRAALA
ncbi:winged helix DNA-binding domain-containing protein [Paraconexibacter antarcticus]|uniref:Winged helix DNA-binding domain-containing protein n=1 Tax=Paraconexibacter antarcticus TaxID=2949664 RepID=A0ABY5DVI1_9ACTN|nr:crosslink repair DNA glycosylase YcaQ family protein [Paraconexibacter antarcticus]UTI66005.1 winged helix DNA-binding domain-containing protein [Paraconexibacter antarcticus]